MTITWRHLEAVRVCLESLGAVPQPDPVDEADAVALITAEQARLTLLRRLLAEAMLPEVASPEQLAPTTTFKALRELLLLIENAVWNAEQRRASIDAIDTHRQWRRTA